MAPAASDHPAPGAELPGAPPLFVPLRAGPLRLVFDRGELRWIRLGEREVLHGIYVAVREAGWATVPARLEALEIEAGPDSFRVGFVARHCRGDVSFEWTGLIEGGADGRIVYSMDGAARSTFLRNRIGLCVLHSAAECAGRPCTIETTDGRRGAAQFPRLVAPHQPFLDVRAIVHEPVPGVLAEVRLEGDTFETEDQRNWSDASFKTYGTPLALPFPVELTEGTRVRQQVTLSLHAKQSGSIAAAAESVPGVRRKRRDGTEPVPVIVDPARAVPVPAIGIGGAELVPLDAAAARSLRPLALSHLRADLHLDDGGWRAALERAVANGRLLSVPLELALFLPDPPEQALRELAERASALSAPVARWLLFRAGDGVSADGDAAAARAALGPSSPAALFGGGVDGHFALLNRRRPSTDGLDLLSFSLTPQTHAYDDATLFESLQSLAWLAETARSFAHERPLAISPVTLRPRRDPRPLSSRPASEPPFTDDPRQATSIAAAWTLGFVGHAAWAGVSSLTLFELQGPRGLGDGGRSFPVLHALAELAALPGAAVFSSRSARPERVQVLALGKGRRARVLLANITEEPHPVHCEGLAGRPVATLLAGGGPCDDDPLVLPPHGIVRLELGGEPDVEGEPGLPR